MANRINYFSIIAKGWGKILFVAVVVGLLAAGLSFVRPLEYRSTVRLLILQPGTLALDPYLATRSQERVSENLANIIETTSFFDKVMAADLTIDRNVFSTKEEKRRKQWRRMADTFVSRGSGLLTVQVYHKNKVQAETVAAAITTVLRSEGWTYLGAGDLTVEVVDAPLTSNWPVRPNVPMNALGGFVLGLILGAVYVGYLAYRHPPHRLHGFLHQ